MVALRARKLKLATTALRATLRSSSQYSRNGPREPNNAGHDANPNRKKENANHPERHVEEAFADCRGINSAAWHRCSNLQTIAPLFDH
jgi:hypothetical protein